MVQRVQLAQRDRPRSMLGLDYPRLLVARGSPRGQGWLMQAREP
ncbi:hypothetical protein ABZ746_32010 [Streptomyces sp. NPDC020096]